MRSVAQRGTQTRTKSVVAPSETLAAWKLLCLSDCGLGTSTCFFLVLLFSLAACALFRPARTRADRRTFRRSCFFFFFVYLLLLRAFLSLPCLLFCFRRYAPPLLLVISSQPDRLPLLPRVVPVCPIICRSLCLRPFRCFVTGPGRRPGIHPGRLLEPRAQHASGVEASSGGECLFCLALKS